jgi:hypothetical protein
MLPVYVVELYLHKIPFVLVVFGQQVVEDFDVAVVGEAEVTDASGFVPKTAAGSETTYYCDGLWFNNSQVDYALVGGNWPYAGLCGARCVSVYDLASYTNASIGSRLSFITPPPEAA